MTWYWAASQVSRLSADFHPRTVRLWQGRGAPTAAELLAIQTKARELSGDLQEWIRDPTRKIRGKRGLIYFVRAGENVERALHHRFRAFRVSGEWFSYNQAIAAFVAREQGKNPSSESPLKTSESFGVAQRSK
jgi:hypothetical protein